MKKIFNKDIFYDCECKNGKTYNEIDHACETTDGNIGEGNNADTQATTTNTSIEKPATSIAYEARFKVVIERTDNPVVGAVVTINGQRVATTNDTGVAHIKKTGIDKDTKITVTAEGYETYTNKIGLASGGNGRVRLNKKRITISGTVVDKKNPKEPVLANVTHGERLLVQTDFETGKFEGEISAIEPTSMLTISAEGYKSVSMKADQLKNFKQIKMDALSVSGPMNANPGGANSPKNQNCGVRGTKECRDSNAYYVCENNDDCADASITVPAHTSKKKCASGLRNGYNICIADKCEDGYEPYQGYCKQKIQSDTPVVTSEPEQGDCVKSGGTLGTNGECVCSGENLKQSDDKKTCVTTKPESTSLELIADKEIDQTDLENQPEETTELETQSEKPIESEPQPEEPTKPDSLADTETTATSTPLRPTQDSIKETEDAYKKAKDNEQSLANRTLTAGTTMATGLGMMTAASAYSEKKADEDAEQDMKVYLATFKCEYGRGQSVPSTGEEITLPGGNELVEYYQEYKSLADNLKNTKKALGLRAGIESEVVYDKAESNLYKYSSVGKNGGAYTSLSRALTDSESEDAAAWNTQKEESAKKLKTGAIAAGGGVVGGIGGDALMNTDMIQDIASKFKGSDTESE